MKHASIALGLWTGSLLLAAWQGRSGRIDRRDYLALLTVAGLTGFSATALALIALVSASEP
jgi:hypothetical protein